MNAHTSQLELMLEQCKQKMKENFVETHLFDPPAKEEVVRLKKKVDAYLNQ